jgi:hypothetical protein
MRDLVGGRSADGLLATANRVQLKARGIRINLDRAKF